MTTTDTDWKSALTRLRNAAREVGLDIATAKELCGAVDLAVRNRIDTGCGLTHEELAVACANVGIDMNCGQCSSVFWTGCGTYPHDEGCKTMRAVAERERLAADNNILVSALAAAHLAIASTDPALARRLTADERVGAFVAVAAAERAVARAAVALFDADDAFIRARESGMAAAEFKARNVATDALRAAAAALKAAGGEGGR